VVVAPAEAAGLANHSLGAAPVESDEEPDDEPQAAAAPLPAHAAAAALPAHVEAAEAMTDAAAASAFL